jgi:hypothetical protein
MWKMKTLHSAWQIADPRKGQDRVFRLDDGTHVSSLKYHCWVAEGPNTDWTVHAAYLDASVTDLTQTAFLIFNPWSALTNSQLRHVEPHFPQVIQSQPWLFVGTSLVRPGMVSRFLGLRETLGADGSGLWAFGTLNDGASFVESARDAVIPDSAIFAAATFLPLISFAICLDDGTDAILLQLSPGTDAVADELTMRLRGVTLR